MRQTDSRVGLVAVLSSSARCPEGVRANILWMERGGPIRAWVVQAGNEDGRGVPTPLLLSCRDPLNPMSARERLQGGVKDGPGQPSGQPWPSGCQSAC